MDKSLMDKYVLYILEKTDGMITGSLKMQINGLKKLKKMDIAVLTMQKILFGN